MAYSYNGIPLNNKEEKSADVHSNVNECQKYYMKKKKPGHTHIHTHTQMHTVWFHLHEDLEEAN